MKWPEELVVTWTRPISCLGRVIPAMTGAAALALEAFKNKDLSDIPTVDFIIIFSSLLGVLFSTWSAWLSTGSSTAREQIKNGTENAGS